MLERILEATASIRRERALWFSIHTFVVSETDVTQSYCGRSGCAVPCTHMQLRQFF